MSRPLRYVIVGSGVAGISAVQAIRSQDTGGEIVLIGDEAFGYYSRPGLAYLLTGELSEAQIKPLPEDWLRRLNVRSWNTQACRLDPERHTLQTKDGLKIAFDRLLIATGAAAQMPDIPGTHLSGVVKLENIEDTRKIIRLARKGSQAVVIGGGVIALEIVEGLLHRNVTTHFFLRKDRYWSNVLDPVEARLIEDRLCQAGARIHHHTEAREILGRGGKVAAVRCKDGRLIECNLAAFGVGVRPKAVLAQEAGLQTNRGVIVNDWMQTSAADIFAAGDTAEVYDPSSGRFVVNSLWEPAREQGRIAGLNMTGASEHFPHKITANVARLAGLTTAVIGAVGQHADEDVVDIARGESENWRQLPDAILAQSNSEVSRLRLVVGERTLLGAVLMGDQTLYTALHQMILEQTDINPIRDRLCLPDAPLAQIVGDYWVEWLNRKTNAYLVQ